MKQFDQTSIQNRLVTLLSSYANWSQIIKDSALMSLLGAIAESESELARYFEYLLKESKWQYAQNLFSLLTEAEYLGYTPERKVSAIGTVTVSHSSILSGAGITVFNKSELDTLIATGYSGSPSSISIPMGTPLYSTKGIYYVTSERAVYSTGMKYLDIPIIQGVTQSQSIVVLGNPFEIVGIHSDALSGFVEAASNSISQEFFSVYVTPPGSTTATQVKIVEDIYMANSDEIACEISISKDYSVVNVMFGNGIAGSLVPANSTVTINYLNTLGETGNENDSFVINKLDTTNPLLSSLFLTNFEAVLGGSDEDTVEEIKNKAPYQYLLDGSIVTADAYKRVIETIPYVEKAVVYKSLYTDPITKVVYNAIMYSALSTVGTAPPSSIVNDVQTIIEDKVSPLDYVSYEAPRFLHLCFGIKATSRTRVANDISMIVKQALYEKYQILNQEFNQTFDNSQLIIDVSDSADLSHISSKVEAIKDLVPSEFVQDTLYTGYYSHSFSFDRSYRRMAGFSDGQIYCLKINIEFLCPGCIDNSRTLFLVQDYEQNRSLSCSFSVADATSGTIDVCGTEVSVNLDDVSTPTKLAIKIASQTIAGYTITNPSPGVVTIVTDPATQAAFISTEIEGISIQEIELTAYKIMQYPLISKITDRLYMTDFVLNPAVAPFEIPSTSTSSQMSETYIPFHVTLDYFSLAPSDPEVTPIASGTLSIPESLSTTVPYLRFSEATPDWLNDNVKIQVMAVPFDQTIESYYVNNIFQINEEDVMVEIN